MRKPLLLIAGLLATATTAALRWWSATASIGRSPIFLPPSSSIRRTHMPTATAPWAFDKARAIADF